MGRMPVANLRYEPQLEVLVTNLLFLELVHVFKAE